MANKPTPPNEQNFSVDLDALAKLAEDADRMAQGEKGKRKARPVTAKATIDGRTVDAEIIPPMDPEFADMVEVLVGCGTELMERQFEWDRPGVQWEDRVANALARMIHRLAPQLAAQGAKWTDAVILLGFLIIYVGSNFMIHGFKRPEKQKTLSDGK